MKRKLAMTLGVVSLGAASILVTVSSAGAATVGEHTATAQQKAVYNLSHPAVVSKAAKLNELKKLTSAASSAHDQDAASKSGPMVMYVASPHGAPLYAKPDSHSKRFGIAPQSTREEIQCQTTKTPSGARWFKLYNNYPDTWVWSGHFISSVHHPKDCW
ncbi:hypothetical protein [Streptomyces natalensis]|uniref:Uncharacterized protein n=1 Tax=Streptomyces natalensis ATCC 27448 TaxID=1240678 RepID=A0A0D7CP83_9ACTN|nr:hypothetical protein [Streptomyces natalensis]KIZ18028.1 hypothetical protein SNA_10130 [Streptomyces natalensis ATCC 27448]